MQARLGLPSAPLALAAAVALSGAWPAPALGQYFGRNQVRYQAFDFRVLQTAHFDLYYYPAEEAVARLAARMAERWYARLSVLLDHELSERQPIILYASHPDFQQTTALSGELGEGTRGVTEAFKRRVVLPLAGPLAETDHVLGHELVHAFQYDFTSRRGWLGPGAPALLNLPLWFVEGMAEYLSLGPADVHTAMWMRDAARSDSIPSLRQLDDPRFFPYRYGHAFWAYLAGRWGERIVAEALRSATQIGAALPALVRATGLAPDTLSRDWRAAIVEAFAPPVPRTPEAHPALIGDEPGAGQLNLAPALSPDGTRLAFLSERGGFAVELYLADARTGAIIRRLVRTALDPHFESLQFLSSAGAWSPDGRRIAVAGVRRGRAVISLLDPDRGRIEREFPIASAGEVFHPTWSPDGRQVAFSAIAGGLSDLFVLDIADGTVRRLTDDPFADLQPAWSPDGRRLAFVSDRFSSDLGNLSWGDYRLAVLDLEAGRIEPVPGGPPGQHLNPQWSPDGHWLYFIAAPGGRPNVYRLELHRGNLRQVTDQAIGVSGITPSSPALSVAAQGGSLAFSAYRGGRYRIYRLELPPEPDSFPLVPPASPDGPAAGRLPPGEPRRDTRVQTLLGNALFGLPRDTTFPERPYRAKLSLDFLAPVSVGVGSTPAGNLVTGGTGAFWSDLLGRHHLGLLFQLNASSVADLGAVAIYQQLGSRWDRALLAGQLPYLSAALRRTGSDTSNLVVDSLYLFRQTDRTAGGQLAYPVSRVQRVELAAGYRMSRFSREVRTRTVRREPPAVEVGNPVALPAPGPIDQVETHLAVVRDNTIFGGTGPAEGERYRVEGGGSYGSLRYGYILTDYRRYLRPVRPYTLALRLLHYGRYGPSADDERQPPLFLGYQALVRGYGFRSADLQRCAPIIRQASDCPVPEFQRLLGSRVLVANLEWRVPLFEGLLRTPRPWGVPPLELAAFADAGAAWTGTERPSFLGGSRKPVSSYGLALRVGLLGAAVLELDAVHPNGRDDKGWHLMLGWLPAF